MSLIAKSIRIQRVNAAGDAFEEVILDAAANTLKNLSINGSGDLTFTTDATGTTPVIDYGKTLFVNPNNPLATDTRTGLDKNDLYRPFATPAGAFNAADADETIVIHSGTESLTYTKNIRAIILDGDGGIALSIEIPNSFTGTPTLNVTGKLSATESLYVSLSASGVTTNIINVDLSGAGTLTLGNGHTSLNATIKANLAMGTILATIDHNSSSEFVFMARNLNDLGGGSNYSGKLVANITNEFATQGAFSSQHNDSEIKCRLLTVANDFYIGQGTVRADKITGGGGVKDGYIYADECGDLGYMFGYDAFSGVARIRKITGTCNVSGTVYADTIANVLGFGGTVIGATITTAYPQGTNSIILKDCVVLNSIVTNDGDLGVFLKNTKVKGNSNQGAIHIGLNDGMSALLNIVLDNCILIPHGTAATAVTIELPATPASYDPSINVIKTALCRMTKPLLPSTTFLSGAVLTDKITSPNNMIDPDFASNF